ncbi:DUF3592 domain-containing protein [Paeniglutamicibacter sp. Y32M11]|uniref:DUF3592 domain-containing protein n=1 Tax=Paeniglutamicibacter sp. Y32M11 TaxID=2853258 RepID=UPI001C532069|nr:DUF3592 domain-containing protein [Paeniglutamicibacter sp. Y32M11]QXQ10607.1 DUF3592 domain-containing protein [Paeniglutamicibacter sp. Y32M11]
MKLILLIIWTLFTLAAVWAMIYTVRKAKAKERLIASWPTTQGRVTGSKKGWFGGAGATSPNVRHWPLYEFMGADGAVYNGVSDVLYPGAPVLGSALLVTYNPVDPRQSFQVSAPSKLIVGCIFPFFIGLCIIGFYFISYLPLG